MLKHQMERALTLDIKGAQPHKLQCMSSDGWQTFCAEGNQCCLSMQVWTYVHTEGASRETLMSVFLVVSPVQK